MIAYQHFYFALLLLAVYEPQNWVPGTEALLSRPKVEVRFIGTVNHSAAVHLTILQEAIQQNTIMIFSLAVSNPKVVTASLTAHHVLYVCKFPNTWYPLQAF